jgi:hypothetical protein
MVVLVLIPLAIGSQAVRLYNEHAALDKGGASTWLPWLSAFGERWLVHSEPSPLQCFIAAFSGLYYIVDFVLLFCHVHPLSWAHKAFFALHHVFCFIGLTVPAFGFRMVGFNVHPSALDCTLAFIGFFLGEISNPPRCVVDLLQYQIDAQRDAWARARGLANQPLQEEKQNTAAIAGGPSELTLFGRSYSMRTVKDLMNSLQNIHLGTCSTRGVALTNHRDAASFHSCPSLSLLVVVVCAGMFIAFRFVGVHYLLRIVWSHAELGCTRVAGGVTLALSLLATLVMLQDATVTAAAPKERQQMKTQVVAPGDSEIAANGQAHLRKKGQ